LALIWFLAGVLTTLVALLGVLPWLRKMPGLGRLSAVPWTVAVSTGLIVTAALGLYQWLGAPDRARQSAVAAAPNAAAANSFTDAVKASGDLAATPAPKAAAGSMESAIAALETRLAKGGGTAGDWELLAKSYEFLHRPADAAKARAQQLPHQAPDAKIVAANLQQDLQLAGTAGSGSSVSGEVSLATALSAKAAAGATLFIVAKSVDSPGPPVAVFRGSVSNWPVKFKLDDSQSMLPGRNLSSAGRVTIEARISQSGQPLPAAGDLQGSSGVINPADHQPLKIVIDRVIT